MTTIQEPSAAQVEQFETPELVTVPVEVAGPVHVKELPTQAGGWTAVALTTAAVKLLARDPRRKVTVLWSDTENIVLAGKQSGATTGGFTWLVNVPLTITAADEVWVASATGTTTVHVYSEVWAP